MNLLNQILDYSECDPVSSIGKRSPTFDPQVVESVAATIEDVRTRGDAALLDSARKYDAPRLSSIEVTEEEAMDAVLPQDQWEPLLAGHDRVAAFHRRQLERETAGFEAQAADGRYESFGSSFRLKRRNFSWSLDLEYGGQVGQRIVPLESAGVCAPGGKHPSPSALMMSAVPASVAGVGRIVVTTPARPDGTIHSAMLIAARTSGVSRIVKVGGATAIAALALGTESIPKVDTIVGPGNRYANEARRQLWGSTRIDGFAGPGEVCVLLDDDASATFAAADLATLLEHGDDASVYIVALSRAKLDEVTAETSKLAKGHHREASMRKALKERGSGVVAKDIKQACDVVNAIAPGYLSIMTADVDATLSAIRNAGCVLLNARSAVSAAVFCAGPSSTLPTGGAARFAGPVSVRSFLKSQSVVRLTRPDLEAVQPVIQAFSEMEGLLLHAKAARLRER